MAHLPRAARLADLIRARGLRKHFVFQARSDSIARHPEVIAQWRAAGLGRVFIGFEKIDDGALDRIGKRNSIANNERALEILRKQGVAVTASFIVDPDADTHEFARLRAYARQHRISSPLFGILTPFPGTELFERVRERLTTTNYELFDLLHAVLPTRLPLPDFYREFAGLYRSKYTGRMADWSGVAAECVAMLRHGRVPLWSLRRLAAAGWQLSSAKGYLTDHRVTSMTGRPIEKFAA